MSGILAALAGIKTAIATAVDEYFNRVTLLLNTSSTNGAQNNTFLDSSTNNFTITRNGNTTQGTFTPFSQTGWGNYFNGSSDYIHNATGNANLAFGTGDFTVECWVYLTTAPTNVYGAPVSVGSTSGGWAVNCVTSGSNFYFRWDTFAGSFALTGNYNTNTWYHVAYVRSGTTITCYVNGVSAATSTGYSENLSVSSNLYIGTAAASTSRYQPGYVSNIRVVKGTAVYTGNFTPSTTPLTAISGTSLLTCQSNRFLDNSASALTFTTGGTPSVQAFSPFLPTAAYDTSVVGGSGYFDGTGDFLQLADSTAWDLTGDYTIEMWLYSTATPVSTTFFQLGSSSNFLAIYLSSATKYITTTGSLSITASTALALNSWNHMALVRSGSGTNNTVLYLNGVNVGQATNTTSFTGSASNGVRIGAEYPSDYYFNGYIAGNRIVNGTAVYTANFTPPTAPPTAITNTSLLANFTNAGIYDSASKNVLETVGNAQVSTTQAKWGTTSMAFDGTGDWLVMPSSQNFAFGTGDFTVEFWVYYSSASANYQFIDARGASYTNGGFALYTTGGSIYVQYGTSALVTATAPSANTWHHIAATRSGTSTKLFIDGTQAGSTATDSNSYGAYQTFIGQFGGGSGYDLNGYIDDLRVTKGYARYTSNFTAPTAAFPLQ